MKQLVIEGWRGINQSYAMVNQNQLLALREHAFALTHVDLPYLGSQWSKAVHGSGFKPELQALVDAIPSRYVEAPDITYRISAPFRMYESQAKKLYVFGTSEYQCIEERMLFGGGLREGLANPGLKIITPSEWSRTGFLRAGFDQQRVVVVPHGVDTQIYAPVSQERRQQFRSALRIADDEFVLMSMGAMTPNKGVDLLVLAYALLKPKYENLRLVLKDASAMYGIKASDIVNEVRSRNTAALTDKVFDSIVFLSDNVTVSQLNGLYAAADCYVSPYRAEGFNLTPLEAAASGTPILVTRGGATDTYFHPSFARGIEGKVATEGNKTYIEPELDSLVEQIETMLNGGYPERDASVANAFIHQRFTWKAVVNQLVEEFNRPL
jgi:glycosyltransferase involved in cell wall biosynthesis